MQAVILPDMRLWDRVGPAPVVITRLIVLLLAAVSLAAEVPQFADERPAPELAEDLLRVMTPEEMLSQVFFVGYHGTRPSESIMRWITERGVGGVKIFTRNVSTLTDLAGSVRRMQQAALDRRLGIPLVVATDQEGGWVQHVKAGLSLAPGNMAIGATGMPREAYLTGYHLGQELRLLGINMNFAPTVDVYSNPEATVVGTRAFSSDPVATALYSVAYFRGMEAAGIICAAKHFPGHGAADRDSHGYLPEVDASWQELWDRDLVPYRLLVREGLPVVMGGHLAFPRILGDVIPSTLSPFFLREVLRERLGFQGVVMTDDLEMHGVHQGVMSMPEVSRRAIEAGNDMILLSHTPSLQEETWEEFRRLLYRDDAFRARIREAVGRILRLKLERLRNGFPLLPDDAGVARRLPLAESGSFFLSSASRAVTMLQSGGLPFAPRAGERILLMGQLERFWREGLRRFPSADVFSFSYMPWEKSTREDRLGAQEAVVGYDTVIFCLANDNGLEVLQTLRDFPGRLIVISALAPVHLYRVPWVKAAVAVYGIFEESFRAGFAVLLGDFDPEGHLPISEAAAGR